MRIVAGEVGALMCQTFPISQISVAYRAVFANATTPKNNQNGVRRKPAITVKGSPTTGTQEANRLGQP